MLLFIFIHNTLPTDICVYYLFHTDISDIRDSIKERETKRYHYHWIISRVISKERGEIINNENICQMEVSIQCHWDRSLYGMKWSGSPLDQIWLKLLTKEIDQDFRYRGPQHQAWYRIIWNKWWLCLNISWTININILLVIRTIELIVLYSAHSSADLLHIWKRRLQKNWKYNHNIVAIISLFELSTTQPSPLSDTFHSVIITTQRTTKMTSHISSSQLSYCMGIIFKFGWRAF